MDGFIVVDKPSGMTSHDVVRSVRRITGEKKAGHTGTLDPFATGVLPLALGEGTKTIHFLDESVKEYQATMVLGATTDTQDFTGTIVAEGDWRPITPAVVEDMAHCFTGRISQVPPMFSALKRNGVPLYKLARRGESVERESRDIEVFSLVIDQVNLPEVAFTVRCSRGTYVRTLASDMGEKLGCGAYLTKLRRTVSGPFHIENAVSLEGLSDLAGEGRLSEVVISPCAALAQLKEVPMTESGIAKVAHGIAPDMADMPGYPSAALFPGERVRLSHGGILLAVAEIVADGRTEARGSLRLLRVFNQCPSVFPVGHR
ncbi:MAG: tRNA pseudouridine55 [Geobacteraceae bacterium]|nr:MAG: tRNA pseudouridine55 [Geobacteraceae bacterium]